MVKYALEFRTLADGSGWNELALKAAFCTGMACHDKELSLDSLIDLVICLDNLLGKRPALRLRNLMTDLVTPAEPKQLSRTFLNANERKCVINGRQPSAPLGGTMSIC